MHPCCDKSFGLTKKEKKDIKDMKWKRFSGKFSKKGKLLHMSCKIQKIFYY